MTDICGCCEGIEQITPVLITNRPGLNALVYRVGTYPTFLETVLARLSSLSIPLGELGPLLSPSDQDKAKDPIYPLQSLTTRDPGDPAIAFLDAWAIVADVFTFYQERIANEGYLRTATLRRSVLELARLAGYELRPGVAASVYLAYTLQIGFNTLIPAGSRVQNIPSAGQLPQSFETSVDLQARAVWSSIPPRMSVPQYITKPVLSSISSLRNTIDLQHIIDTNVSDGSLYLAGTSTNLKPRDPLLFVFGADTGMQVFTHIQASTTNAEQKYTNVTFPVLFTPLVFLRKVRDLADRYLDIASFGVNSGDQGVAEIVAVLELINVALVLGIPVLETVARGSTPLDPILEVSNALLWVGRVLAGAECLLHLLISDAQSFAIRDTVTALSGLPTTVPVSTITSVTTLLQSVDQALAQFLAQVIGPDVNRTLQLAIAMVQPFTDPSQDANIRNLAQIVQQRLQALVDSGQTLTLTEVAETLREALAEYGRTGGDAQMLAGAIEKVLESFIQLGLTNIDLITVWVAIRQALSPLHVTDSKVIAIVQAALSILNQMLQTIHAEIDTLLQGVNNALDTFSSGLANLFTPSSQAVKQAQAIGRALSRSLAYAFTLPAIRSAMSISSGRLSTTGGASVLGQCPDPLCDILLVWSNIYKSAATGGSSTSNVANWAGGLINDTKNLVSSIPGIDKQIKDIPTAAVIIGLGRQVAPLAQPSNLQPASSARLTRSVTSAFARTSDIAPQLLTTFVPQISSTLYTAFSHSSVTPPPQLQNVYALRVKAAPFGSSAPKQVSTTATTTQNSTGTKEEFKPNYTEWPIADTDTVNLQVLYLDSRYDHIVPESWIVIEYSDKRPLLFTKIQQVQTVARADYGISAKVTQLTLYDNWLTSGDKSHDLSLFRGINIYAQSEVLPLADRPVTDDVQGDTIELNDIYDGLQSGSFVVVSGERTDIHNTTGVTANELMMLQSVTQEAAIPGDTTHTKLHFATPLVHTYKLSTVTVNANVVPATHGETQKQILGSGSGGTAMQRFSLVKAPLTYVPATTPTGETSTLEVRVNNILWHETNSLDGKGPNDRIYITRTDNQDKVTITFGNGIKGARLPTGAENVKAIYRTGIGTPGNVGAGLITQLVSRPLGVKAVYNPLSATGGADRDTLEQARSNVPLASTSLGRIVSVQDYADFVRTFAGIGKASAAALSDGQQQVVALTIVGQDNIPVDTTSSLYQNLVQSLQTYGDPSIPFIVLLAEVKLLVISARVHIQADYLFDDVAAALRAALLDAFGFQPRDLGQPVFQSEVLSVMQHVAGVAYVDLDYLDAIDQQTLLTALQQIQADALKAANATPSPSDSTQAPETLASLLNLKNRKIVPSALAQPDSKQAGKIDPAQLVFLSGDLPDTLILNQLTTLHFTPHHPHHHKRSHL